MERRETERGRQAAATRKKILRCGVRLLDRHGYENVSVAQISKKAGVSVGTFYHYFPSKFDLLVEVYRLGDQFFLERVPGLLRRCGACPECVIEYFCLYAQLALQNGIGMVRNLYVPTNRMFLSPGRAMQGLLTDILRGGQGRGELTGGESPETMTEKLFVVARGVIFDWCLHDGKTDLEAEMREIITRLVRSYRP